jgi:citrate synthase
MSEQSTWTTEIAQVTQDDVMIRGYLLSDLVGKITYVDSIFLVITGELPSAERKAMMEAIFVSLIEHGISPSTIVTRMLTSCGTPMQAALAGGALSVADWHGGAGAALGEELEAAVKLVGPVEEPLREAGLTKYAEEMVTRYRQENVRFEGFGHPQHTDGDPRATQLFALAENLGVLGPHSQLAMILDREIEKALGRRLPINVNGAVAALLLDLGFPAASNRGLVIGARMTGLVGHVVEELEQGNRWRHAPGDEVSYVGPKLRKL